MNFNEADRRLLGQLADVLIPAGDGQPSASAAEVAGPALDAIVNACPDLATGLTQLLAHARGKIAANVVADLRAANAPEFDVLAEFAANAYFLNPAVRHAIGYDGQTARSIDPHPDYLDDELLASVVARGTIYRPTRQ